MSTKDFRVKNGIIVGDSADISNDLTVQGNATIVSGSITGTDVDVSGATFTVANDQISGDAINGGTATPTTLNSTNLNVDSGTLFVDSANNRVGVGTSSPTERLELAGGSFLSFKRTGGVDSGIIFEGDNNTDFAIIGKSNFNDVERQKIAFNNVGSFARKDIAFYTTNASNYTDSGVKRFNIGSNGDISFYEDTGTTPKFFWDASAERLGIRTSSPQEALDINGNIAAGSSLRFKANAQNVLISQLDDGNHKPLLLDSIRTQFLIEGSEAARIDSSGNLLVGKTSPNFNTQGIELKNTGFAAFTTDSDRVVFNRNSSDGDIIDFRKDGSKVGSIGSIGGDIYVGTGNTSIRFTGNDIRPVEFDGSNNDNQTDLGDVSSRFKDLYLSGTATANAFSGDGSNVTNIDYNNITETTAPLIQDSTAPSAPTNGQLWMNTTDLALYKYDDSQSIWVEIAA